MHDACHRFKALFLWPYPIDVAAASSGMSRSRDTDLARVDAIFFVFSAK